MSGGNKTLLLSQTSKRPTSEETTDVSKADLREARKECNQASPPATDLQT